MLVTELEGVSIPDGWQSKYPSLRYYKNRLRTCSVCSGKFFEIREQVRPPRSLFCASCAVERDFHSDIHPTPRTVTGILRVKSCRSCLNEFTDYSKLNLRRFCYFCNYFYSTEELTLRASRNPAPPSFWDKTPEFLVLYDARMSDAAIARRLNLAEHQVGAIRERLGLEVWSHDRVRRDAGYPSVSEITPSILRSKSTGEISKIYGVSTHLVKSLRRSTRTYREVPEWFNAELNGDEYQVILGTALGDGHLMKRSGGRYALGVSHKRDHGSYVYWLGERIPTVKPTIRELAIDTYLRTAPNITIGKIARNLYSLSAKKKFGIHGSKVPSRELLNSLDPLGLAVLYMDDGSVIDEHAAIALYYPGLPDQDLSEPLFERFGINFYRRPSSKYSFFLSKRDTERLCEIISPHFSPIMSYKLPPRFRTNKWEEVPKELNGYHSTYYATLDDDGKKEFEEKLFELMAGKGPAIKFHYDVNDIKHALSTNVCEDKRCKWARSGLSLLDDVFPHRMNSRRDRNKSVAEAWNDPFFFSTAIHQLAKNDRTFTPLNIRGELINLVKAPAHFNPSVAASILNEFKPVRVLDPMIGWGGRSLAALCNPRVRRFVGCDLQSNSVASAHRLAHIVNTRASYDFHHVDSTRWMGETHERFDLVLTSPPFFNTERYEGVESTDDLNLWYQTFFIPFLSGCKRVLTNRGRVVLHLEDAGKVQMVKLLHRALNTVNMKIVDSYIYNSHSRIEKEQLLYVLV